MQYLVILPTILQMTSACPQYTLQEEELVKRILLRGKDSGRADDASEDIIRNRIAVYNQQTAVVADYYRAQDKYIAVPSLGTIEEVFDRIATVIRQIE